MFSLEIVKVTTCGAGHMHLLVDCRTIMEFYHELNVISEGGEL